MEEEGGEKGQPIYVMTSYRNWGELPARLVRSFDLVRFKNNRWVDGKSGDFVPNRRMSVGLSRVALFILVGTGIVIGLVVGGMLGWLIQLLGPYWGLIFGAIAGLVLGVILSVIANRQYRVEVEIDPEGLFTLKLGGKQTK